LGGKQSQFNSVNTWVYGFVVAEHHQQLATCIRLIENFIGINFSENVNTLDWKIRHLSDAPIVSDDFGCPGVELDFTVLSSSSTSGTLVKYNVLVQGNGDFKLNFGDGQSTSSSKSGTHLYAPGATIDPVVILQNNNCQIVQTNITRTVPNTPTVSVIQAPFIIPVPIPPQIPTIVIPSLIIPATQINIPPVVFPSFPSIIPTIPSINIPSVIDFSPLHIPSHITITPISIPSMITGPNINIPSQITINQPTFPTLIPIGPAPPIAPIQITPPIIPPIQLQIPANFSLPSVIQIESVNLPSSLNLVHNLHDITLNR